MTGDHFAVKLQMTGKRMTLGLRTANKEEAAQRARKMYLDLVAGGWDLMLANHRPKATEVTSPTPKQSLTFGEYVDLVRSKNLLSSKSIDGYAMRLRTIVSDVMGIRSTNKKYAAETSARQAWLDKVDAVPVASVTPDMVRRWKRTTIEQAGNAIARTHAVTSVNSTMRQARSLFGQRKVLRFLPGIPNPFEGVEFEPRVDTRFYGVGIDAPTLLRRALHDLADRKEELKAFLLAICLGLRRKEADLLEWTSFDFVNSTVTVKPTESYALKTVESAAILALDPEFTAMFRGWYALRRGPFVIESDNHPRPGARYNYYRCDHVFDSLVEWLRLQGVTGDKPFHVLRKMFGSLIVEKHGVFAASSALRHTSIELTNQYYLDRTVRTTSGLGSVISSAAE